MRVVSRSVGDVRGVLTDYTYQFMAIVAVLLVSMAIIITVAGDIKCPYHCYGVDSEGNIINVRLELLRHVLSIF